MTIEEEKDQGKERARERGKSRARERNMIGERERERGGGGIEIGKECVCQSK